jgi:hypothetical protein
MNDKLFDLLQQSEVNVTHVKHFNGHINIERFAELIIRECASIARSTNLEEVEGGDSAVLRAASEQIKEHFGVEE